MVRKFSLENNFLRKLSSEEEWKRERSTYSLKANSIKWYADGSKTNKGIDAGIFGPEIKYSEPMRLSSTLSYRN